MSSRATMVIPRDYSPLTRWDRSNNQPRSSSCSNSRDRCRRQGRQHPHGNHRSRRKPFLHLRPLQPANFHLVLILALQILRPNIGCNGPLLHLRLRLSCQVGWHSLRNSLPRSRCNCTLRIFTTRLFFSFVSFCYWSRSGKLRLILNRLPLILWHFFFFLCDHITRNKIVFARDIYVHLEKESLRSYKLILTLTRILCKTLKDLTTVIYCAVILFVVSSVSSETLSIFRISAVQS